MKIAVIDIGSNSVRLMIQTDGKTLYKTVRTTRLGEKLSLTGILQQGAMERTASAVKELYDTAVKEGAERICVFATAAVRSAKNGFEFTDLVKHRYGIDVDVIAGEVEARIGLLGAVGKGKGGIIDVGGASTEISVRDENRLVYTKSLNIGTVRLFDLCGGDVDKLGAFIREEIKAFGDVPLIGTMYAIGGTATTVAAVDLSLERFQEDKVHLHVISYERMRELTEQILPLSVEQRRKIRGMDLNKLDVIGGGMLLLTSVMEYLHLPSITVSCADNLEGYAIEKDLLHE